uniref:Uncharacterized protein n=1 Tax=Anguilla anguilla TaxID=7936 RepID=A0A0E9UKW7_ANGAN
MNTAIVRSSNASCNRTVATVNVCNTFSLFPPSLYVLNSCKYCKYYAVCTVLSDTS